MPLSDQLVQDLRDQFPALSRTHNGNPVVFLDGPAGTQVPNCVVDAMRYYLFEMNANMRGEFQTSRDSDDLLNRCHLAAAEFVGSTDPGEVAFGQNMTSLTFALSRSLARDWNAGEEIIVTRLDHDANVTPWVMAAADAGCHVKFVDFNKDGDCRLDLDQLKDLLNNKTRLVAFGAASNATGGINPVKEICSMVAQRSSATTFVDAVHLGPHRLIDVQNWGCDFLSCSAYKFFGPHVGIMWGRRELLESLTAYKVRPASDRLPWKWMSGTQNHEGIAGTMAAIDYLAAIGRQVTESNDSPRREALQNAFEAITEYENRLAGKTLDALQSIDGIKIHGITDRDQLQWRVPTFSISHPAKLPKSIAGDLGDQGVYVWDGHYYALQFTEALGLVPHGMVRIGLVHYNTLREIDRLQIELERSLSGALMEKG